MSHCPKLNDFRNILWDRLWRLIAVNNTGDAFSIFNFFSGLDECFKVRFLLGGLKLPFGVQFNGLIDRFITSSIFKMFKTRHELMNLED